jgi:hypothetical protein
MALKLSELEDLVPALEAAVYDPIIERIYGEVSDTELREHYRKRIAGSIFCLEVCVSAEKFLKKLGFFAVHKEVHVYAKEDWLHAFLSIPTQEEDRSEDIIIDPTYLQFLHSSEPSAIGDRSRVFIGTRSQIIEFISTSPDMFDTRASDFYKSETLSKSQTR